MKLARTAEITCDTCDTVAIVRDGDEVRRYAYGGVEVGVRVIGEKTPATKADLVNAVVARGWSATIPDKAGGETRVSGEGAHILIIRTGMRLACPACSVKDDPTATPPADSVDAILSSLRDLNTALARHFGE